MNFKENTANQIYKLAFVAPTCFYYQVPIFRRLSAHNNLDLIVYFCSNESMSGRDVAEKFNTQAQWGGEENLLNGYQNKHLKNYSPFPSYLRWPFGLINFGIWNEIRKTKPDAVILMSWTNPTWWLAILACKIYQVPFMFLTDTNVRRDIQNPWWKVRIKKLLLGSIMFRWATGFLASGESNRNFYKYYNVSDSRIVDFAFSWELSDYLEADAELRCKRDQLRLDLDIPKDTFVIVYCGRFSKEKGAIDLLKAYHQVESTNKMLLLVGDGPERDNLEKYISANNVQSVRITGFQTRTSVPKYYAISDVLVLPSLSEATGAVVNEAMCFGLPVIVSNQVGFADEFVIEGENGFIFPVGDTSVLAKYIELMINMPKERRKEMMTLSRKLITDVAKRDLAANIYEYINIINTVPRRPA